MSRLSKAKRGKLNRGNRFVFYGTKGIGKSTLATFAPDPLFFDLDDGTAQQDIARYPFRDEPGGHVAQSFEEVLAALSEVEKEQHSYKTLVIDTLDKLEKLIWDYVCKRDSGQRRLSNIEDYGYAKGYTVAMLEFRLLCDKLDRILYKKNMSIILIGHSQIRIFKNPMGEDFDRYHLSINDKSAGLLKGWADVVGFCRFDEGGDKLDKKDRPRGWSTGKRFVHFKRTAAYDAKTQISLPTTIELDITNPWSPIAEAIRESNELTEPQLLKLISVECERINDPETTKRVQSASKGKDATILMRYLQELKTRQPKEEDAQ